MKNKVRFRWILVLFSVGLATNFYFNFDQIKAATYVYIMWGTQGKSTVVTAGVNAIPTSQDLIVLTHTGIYTNYEFYNADHTLKVSYNKDELTENLTSVPGIKKGDYIKITNSGSYKGKMIDIIYTSVNTESLTAKISKNGSISLEGNVPKNSAGYDVPRVAIMKLVEHDTSNSIPYAQFLLPLNQPQVTEYITVAGYDVANTDHFYAFSGRQIDSSLLAETSEGRYAIEFANNGKSIQYAVKGTSDSSGEYSLYGSTYHVVRNPGKWVYNLNLIAPEEGAILPTPYPIMQIGSDRKTTDQGRKMNLQFDQYLPMQSSDAYFPINDSEGNALTLQIDQKDATFLNVVKEDFEMSIDNKVISPEEYNLTVTKGSDKIVKIGLSTAFLKTHQGEMVNIKQTSTIIDDEQLIKESLIDQKLTFDMDSLLLYKFNDRVQPGSVQLQSERHTVQLTVEPEITFELLDEATVSKGSKVSDVPIATLVKNQMDKTYSWDTVTASYAEPNASLNNSGPTNVKINLTSDTFGMVIPIVATVNVISGYSLRYDANGGKGTVPSPTTFTNEGMVLASGESLDKQGFVFGGWSTQQIPSSNTIIYKPADVYGAKGDEQQNTVLYAVWNAVSQLTAEANGVQHVRLGRLSEDINPSFLNSWVKNVKIDDKLLDSEDYNVILKSELQTTVVRQNIETVVTVTSKTNENDYADIKVLVDVVWGNTISLGLGESDRPMYSLSLIDVESDYQVVAGFADTANVTAKFSTEYSDEPYIQVDYFNMASDGSTMEVTDSLELKGSVSQVIEGKSTAETAMSQWGDSQNAQKVNVGDIIRVWMKEPAKEFLYTQNKRTLVASDFPNGEWMYYRVTKNGFEEMYFNQLVPKSPIVLSAEETLSEEDYNKTYESITSYFYLPEDIEASKYKSVLPAGFHTYPKLGLAVDELSDAKVYVAEKDESNVAGVKFSYDLIFKGTGELLEIKQPVSLLNFEIGAIMSQSQEVERKDADWGFTVMDRRGTKTPWTIKAKMLTPFATDSGEDELKGATLQVKNGTQLVELNESPVLIYTEPAPSIENKVVWEANQGFSLHVPPGRIKKDSIYQAEIEFLLEDTP